MIFSFILLFFKNIWFLYYVKYLNVINFKNIFLKIHDKHYFLCGLIRYGSHFLGSLDMHSTLGSR